MRYMQRLDALATTVRAEMDRQKLNTYKVADRAAQRGHKIVHGTVWNVINQNVKEVKDKTIVAIARGLGIQEDDLFSVLRGNLLSEQVSDERFKRIAKGYAQLSEAEKQTLEPFLAAIETAIGKGLSAEKISVKKSSRSGVKKEKKSFSSASGEIYKFVDEDQPDEEND